MLPTGPVHHRSQCYAHQLTNGIPKDAHCSVHINHTQRSRQYPPRVARLRQAARVRTDTVYLPRKEDVQCTEWSSASKEEVDGTPKHL
jgi:hypothetical protein